jgi:hypothetical protein
VYRFTHQGLLGPKSRRPALLLKARYRFRSNTVPITSSSDTTGGDLPTVTPKQRSFADTINKQNRENKALREQLLRDKITQLEQQLYATEQALDYNANDPNGGRTPSQQNSVRSMSPAPPFSPHGLTPVRDLGIGYFTVPS